MITKDRVLTSLLLFFLAFLFVGNQMSRIPETRARQRSNSVRTSAKNLSQDLRLLAKSSTPPNPVPIEQLSPDAAKLAKYRASGMFTFPESLQSLITRDEFSGKDSIPLLWLRRDGADYLASMGPDERYTFDFATEVPAAEWLTSPDTINWLYDPTNGSVSPGDILHRLFIKNQ